MVEVAKPYKHPETGAYYIRRQIPAALRPAFGGRQLYKKSLETKDAKRAAALFPQANAELEARFDEARARLRATGSPVPSSRDRATELIHAYANGPAANEGGLDGPRRLELARREIDRGLWNGGRLPDGGIGLGPVPPSTSEEWAALAGNAALFAVHRGTVAHVGGVEPGGVWQRRDLTFAGGGRADQLARLAEQIALHRGLALEDLPAEFNDELEAFLDALPVGPIRSRRPRETTSRLRHDMTMSELFDAWRHKEKRRPQTLGDFANAVRDFMDLVGDIPASQATHDDLLNFRDEIAKLPVSMPRADRLLPLRERVAKHALAPEKDQAPQALPEPAVPIPARVAPGTVKKQVGAIQAMLSLAAKEGWVPVNVARDVPIDNYRKTGTRRRLPFEDEDLKRLFSSPLFTSPETWNWKRRTTCCTLFWLFLINATTGARIEEVGQARLADVKTKGRVTYIDVDDYSDYEMTRASLEAKSVKNADSRRLVPLRDEILALGFTAYCDALRDAGHDRLFPDLRPNRLGKTTHDASRRVNGKIDRIMTTDRRYVFHSFRHGFGDIASEAEIQDRVIDQIRGHAPTDTGGRYGTGVRLSKLHEWLHRIEWAFLDWPALTDALRDYDWLAAAARHRARRQA